MNASRKSNTSASSTTAGITQPQLRVAVRILWFIVAAISVAVFALGFPVLYEYVYSPPDAAWMAALTQLGISPDFYFAYTIVLSSIMFLIFATVAVILFSRRPDDRMALFVPIVLMAFGSVTTNAAYNMWSYGKLGTDSLTNLFSILYFVASSIGWPFLVPLLLIFPDGRFVPRWMRYISVFGFIFAATWNFFPQEFAAPTGLMAVIVSLGAAITLASTLYAQVYRYRRVSTTLQRQQTKWFVLGISLFLTLTLASVFLSALLPFYQQSGPAPEMLNTFSALFSVCIPLSIGVAILRYRLWDIDVVINRALIYGSLTAILAGVWAGSVVLINQASEEMFASESATTAAVVSTVLVASVFQPLRGRIEEWINKRLYPEKFNLMKDFYEFTPHMQGQISTADLLKVTVQRVTDLMHSKLGAILLDEGDGTFVVAEAYMLERDAVEALILPKKVRDQLEKSRTVSQSDGDPFVILVPLFVPRLGKNQLIGVLGLGAREKGRGYSGDDKRALAVLGGGAGKAILAAKLDERKWEKYLTKALGPLQSKARPSE